MMSFYEKYYDINAAACQEKAECFDVKKRRGGGGAAHFGVLIHTFRAVRSYFFAKEGIAETVETAALSGRGNVGAKTVFGTKLELISRQSAAGRLPVRADHK